MIKSLVNRIEEIFIITALGVMCVILALQVFCRYVLNSPLIWSEELVRYLFVWITFIGAGYGVKHHLHIEMEALFNLFPKVVQKIVQALINVAAIGFYAYIIPDSITFCAGQQGIDSTTLGIPMSFVYAAVPVGCSILVIRLIIDTIDLFRTTTEMREKVFVE